ncbi:ArsR family transcriptional regulator [Aeromicrobium phragmitis]|uniref:ArsR family transcriptional regulator n=1 Tax=Aeromicrobium phragmitis TaxID=2478914 RepID=A0A3L8PKQ0_9ACTN|nr:winged helix-turn-helix domain-containing protein [Aeromicrobium phragmitis]RLV55820.1 ArsR family transcriptional regulator [Aeromicrobium phragmitis]
MLMEERIARLEERVAALEEAPAAPGPSAGDFWVLDGLRPAAEGNDGVVVWAGIVETGMGPAEWQMGRPVAELIDPDRVDAFADRLAALGHPVRLSLVLAVLRGTTKVTDLAEQLALASTGQIYHHLKALTAAGWLRQAARGHVTVPAERVVPLLVAVGVSS